MLVVVDIVLLLPDDDIVLLLDAAGSILKTPKPDCVSLVNVLYRILLPTAENVKLVTLLKTLDDCNLLTAASVDSVLLERSEYCTNRP